MKTWKPAKALGLYDPDASKKKARIVKRKVRRPRQMKLKGGRYVHVFPGGSIFIQGGARPGEFLRILNFLRRAAEWMEQKDE